MAANGCCGLFFVLSLVLVVESPGWGIVVSFLWVAAFFVERHTRSYTLDEK
jgi:hypothetical protein